MSTVTGPPVGAGASVDDSGWPADVIVADVPCWAEADTTTATTSAPIASTTAAPRPTRTRAERVRSPGDFSG